MIASDRTGKLSRRIYANRQLATINFSRLIELVVHVQPGEDLLDLGCGIGQITARLARESGSGTVIGFDINGESVKKANQIFATEGLCNARAHVYDASQVPFRIGERELQEAQFDIIVSTSALYNVGRLDNDYSVSRRQEQAIYSSIKEIYRLLKPRGRFIANSPTLANTRDLLNLANVAGAVKETAIKQIRLPEFVTFQAILPSLIRIFETIHIAHVQNPIIYNEEDIGLFLDYFISSDFWTNHALLTRDISKSIYLAEIVRQIVDAMVSKGRYEITKDFLVFACYKLPEESPKLPFASAIKEWPSCLKAISVETAFRMGSASSSRNR